MVDASPRPPQDYPWSTEQAPIAVLRPDGTATAAGDWYEAEQALEAAGAPGIAERSMVLAVGSNRSPDVLAAKYARAGLLTSDQVATVLVTATVTGMGVGHSAHASAPGYVPAAPFAAPGVRTEVTALWVTAPQRAAIDATEPNYDLVTLPVAQVPVEPVGGPVPERTEVYASRHGVIGRLRPLPLHATQQELFDRLAVLVDPDPFGGDAAEVCARLASDPEAARALLSSHGLALPDDLPRS